MSSAALHPSRLHAAGFALNCRATSVPAQSCSRGPPASFSLLAIGGGAGPRAGVQRASFSPPAAQQACSWRPVAQAPRQQQQFEGAFAGAGAAALLVTASLVGSHRDGGAAGVAAASRP